MSRYFNIWHMRVAVALTVFVPVPVAMQAGQPLPVNGDRITGERARLDDVKRQYEPPYGAALVLDRAETDGLRTDVPLVVDLASGESVIGTITDWSQGLLVITSESLGKISVPTRKIVTIRRTISSTLNDQQGLTETQMGEIRGTGSGPLAGKSTDSAGTPPATDRPIGEKPQDADDIRKLFVRQSSVLLRPGQVELEAGFIYERNEQAIGGFQSYTDRQLRLPLALRAGLAERLEGFLAVPLAYRHVELDEGGTVVGDDAFGIGDTSGGLKYLLSKESDRWPDIITSFFVHAPSGGDPYKGNEGEIVLGTGHWGLGGGVQLVKTFDPVILFGGVDYTYAFARHALNSEVRVGGTIGYNFGVGFAINADISVSTQLTGAFQCDAEIDGTTIPGSAREPVLLRLAVTNRWQRNLYLEPSVTAGLNQDAPDFVLGVSCVYQLGGR